MRAAKIIPLPIRAGKRSYTSAEDLIEEVRRELFGSGEAYKQLATKVGVASSTIANIASGQTKWPRPTTLFPLLDTLGLEMKVVKKGSGDA